MNIAGGVCYFLWERDYFGHCMIANVTGDNVSNRELRNLNEFPVLVRNNTALHVIRKVLNYNQKTLNIFVSSYSYFAIRSYERGVKDPQKKDDVILLSSNGKGFYNRNKIEDKKCIIDKWKVVITYAMSGGNKPTINGDYQVISSLQILAPNEVCTETYLVLNTFNHCCPVKVD